jgi:hypothetical protein
VHTALVDLLPALRRPAGVAAGVAAVAAAAAAATPWLPVWQLVARVEVAGTTDVRAVASLTGAQATPWVWFALLAGIAGAGAAASVALDLPLPGAEPVALAAAVALAAVAVLLALSTPAPAAFASSAVVRDLLDGSDALPSGVGIALEARAAAGLWLLAGTSFVVAVGTSSALRRG